MSRVRRIAVLVATTVAAFPLLTSTPAQAACAYSWDSLGLHSAYACTSGDCRVAVLGQPVLTCP